MKKLLNSFLVICVVLLMASCTKSAQNKLNATAEQINQELPMDFGNGICMDSLTYDEADNTLIFHYALSEEYQTVGSLRGAHDAQRRFLTSYLSSQAGNEFTKLLVVATANISLEYTGSKTGDKTTLTFYAKEIKEILDGQEDAQDDRTVLSNLLAVTNDQCPVQLNGDDLVMTGVALGDENIEFYYTYNPEVYEFDPANTDALKALMKPALQEELSAPGNAMQLELMKKLNLGITYTFEGEGHDPITFGFTAQEVQEL